MTAVDPRGMRADALAAFLGLARDASGGLVDTRPAPAPAERVTVAGGVELSKYALLRAAEQRARDAMTAYKQAGATHGDLWRVVVDLTGGVPGF
jgi:hypothetical protein